MDYDLLIIEKSTSKKEKFYFENNGIWTLHFILEKVKTIFDDIQ